ncbi:hypothetical protein [uncultured Brevundimonas sp.]|uniref:hypothetical protein n=1 Tax=uncultured Brevundimonas sp. TaxID=213418 RepID=UPI0025E516DB|nr:hypothetical protein [uncultured Brevundimonas sp.]
MNDRDLNRLLDASPHLAPSAALRDRVLASAIEAGLTPRGDGWLTRWRVGLRLTLGAGWAAAACAGVMAGLGVTTQATQAARADAVLSQAAFTSLDDAEVLAEAPE